MKVTIDSKHDSEEAINKAIELLQYLARNKTASENSYQETPKQTESSQASTNAFTSMFGSTDIGTQKEAQIKQEEKNSYNTPAGPVPTDSAPDFTKYLNLIAKTNSEKKEEQKEEPKIELF